MSLTEEQLELRKTGVGASEAAAACGLSPWNQTAELYRQKIGEAAPQEVTRDILFGNFMEAGGIRYWEALRETPVEYPLPTVRHPEHQWMLSTPDGQIGPRKGLEFKTMDFFRFKQLEKNGIADVIPEYLIQCQHQMMVSDWDVVVIAIMVGKDLHDIEVERNERLQNLIVERESIFWDHVQRRIPPDVDFSRADALRCVQAMHPEVKTGDVIPLSEELSKSWQLYEDLGKKARECEKQRKAIKARILSEIGDDYAGLLSDGSRMIRRKWIDGTDVSYHRDGYVDVRAVKYAGEPIKDGKLAIEGYFAGEVEEEQYPDDEQSEPDAIAERIDARLKLAGFLLHAASESGSRYYVHSTEPMRVRVSDHEPNAKTAAWMERSGSISIRTDAGMESALQELDRVTEKLVIQE